MSRQIFLWLLAALFFLINVQPSLADRGIERKTDTRVKKRLALVIGNSNYLNSPLKNPVNDARDIANALENNGFKVTLLIDAGSRQMKDSIRNFGNSLRPGSVGLFYFAGHGMQQNGRNYLIPVDARIESESDVEYEAVDAGRILGKMEDAGNDVNIVILDACRNNPFARSFRSIQRGLARMDAPTGSLVAYATAPGSVAADGTGSNGVYTKYLLKYINEPGVAIEQVFKQVRRGVLKETARKQTPWESSSLTGNFSFAGGDTTVSIADPPATTFFDGEDEFWKAIQNSTDINDFQSYLDAYPDGRFAAVARFKQEKLKPEVQKVPMTIRPSPSDALVRILHIKPRYFDGIELAVGTYSIEVSKQGYKTRVVEVTLTPGNNNFRLGLAANSPGLSSGTIVEAMTSGGYTYMLIKSEDKQQWVAVSAIVVKTGETVSYYPGTVMPNFKSRTLNRTFDSVIFSKGLVGR